MKVNYREMGRAFLIILIYIMVVPICMQLIITPFLPKDANLILTTIVNLLVYFIDVAIVFFIHRKSIFKEWKDYVDNFKKYFKVALQNWGKGFILMILINTILLTVTNGIAANEASNRELLNQNLVFSIIAMVFLGPILEEIVFRKGFKNVFENKTVFLIFTSLLFGSMHIISSIDFNNISLFLQNWQQILYIIPYSTLGFFFGKAYLETDCIFTSITAHIFHNGLTILIIILSQGVIS